MHGGWIFFKISKRDFMFIREMRVDDLGFRYTVFPRIVVATTILFLGFDCDNYSKATTIQGRKLLSLVFCKHT